MRRIEKDLMDIHFRGTSLEKFKAMHAPDRYRAHPMHTTPWELSWCRYQGSSAKNMLNHCMDQLERARFTERTGIELFDKAPLKELAR